MEKNCAFVEAVDQCARLKAAHAGMAKGTDEEEGVYYAWTDALEAAIEEPVSTARDLLTKLDVLSTFQANSSLWADCTENFVKRQVAALVADVRCVLSAEETTPHRRFGGYTGDQWRAYMGPMHCSFVADFARQYAEEIEKLEAVQEMLEVVDGGKKTGVAFGALTIVREVIATMQRRVRHAEVDAERHKEAAEECGAMTAEADEESGGTPPIAKPHDTAEDSTFANALANFRRAKNFADRQPHDTEQQAEAYKTADDAFAAMVGCWATTPEELRQKMDAFAVWRLEYDIDGEKGEQIAAIFDDVRRMTATPSAATSPEIAARVQAWREACDRCLDDHHESDVLCDAKRAAYDALIDEPIQSIGDLAALARAMTEEDDITDGRAMAPYDPAFAALFAGIEALAGEG